MERQKIASDERQRIFAMKLWDGRFKKPTDGLMEAFNNSLPFDKALIDEDIAGSIAWARALRKAGILSAAELGKIEKGLRSIAAKAKSGDLDLLPGDEDIHMAVERLLTSRIGDAGAKLHTGRSRNDQVATDVRLFVKKTLAETIESVRLLQKSLVTRAKQDIKVIVPAYTHLQQAQPVLLAHYWLSFFFALEREKSRLGHAIAMTDACPLGAGAVAGSGFNVDRSRIARDLGFGGAAKNSIDAVASRDYLLEALGAISSIGILCSRYAEDLIIWSSREFGFVELDDAWSSGSSMMPQKKNPDSLELIRGKSGRFIGNYTRCATMLKGVGLAYYKDLQEDKEPYFDSIRHIGLVLSVFSNVLGTLSVNAKRIESNMDPFLLATDCADYLVRKGLPFRQAHRVIGKIVAHCIEKKVSFFALSQATLKTFSPLFGSDVKRIFSWDHALSQRELEGGTGRRSVRKQIADAEKILKTAAAKRK
jgi:argininosuccinate lyase